MKAVCWDGVNRLKVANVAEPTILNSHDAIVRVTASATCGSDLHLIGGYIPAMRAGDVIGHEFIGEVAEVGSAVTKHSVGDRVVVSPFLGCGKCWYCQNELYSQCDNTNPHQGLGEAAWGAATAGCLGYSQITGGFAGSHAEYVRVPFADSGAFRVPDGLSDEQAVFASDAAPTGWMGAEFGGVKPGDTVAVWGAGAVGQLAARASILLGAERVIVIDRVPHRLDQVMQHIGAETLDFSRVEVLGELREWSGGRGPDVCIEAVGMEAHSPGAQHAYDQVKQQLRLQTGRPGAVREAIMAARKGGSVFVLGVFAALVDKFPLGAVMNKGLTLRGAQVHAQRFIPMLLERIANGEIPTAHLATHTLALDDAQRAYELFKRKEDDCVRVVLRP